MESRIQSKQQAIRKAKERWVWARHIQVTPRLSPAVPHRSWVQSVSQKTREIPETLTAAVNSLIVLARDEQPAAGEVWCNPGHSPDPAEFREVLPSTNFISDGLFPRIFIYILTTWVSTPLKTTQGCYEKSVMSDEMVKQTLAFLALLYNTYSTSTWKLHWVSRCDCWSILPSHPPPSCAVCHLDLPAKCKHLSHPSQVISIKTLNLYCGISTFSMHMRLNLFISGLHVCRFCVFI